jgi:hypothetical protein
MNESFIVFSIVIGIFIIVYISNFDFQNTQHSVDLKKQDKPVVKQNIKKDVDCSLKPSQVEFQNILLKEHPILERDKCKFSKDIPIANINVQYLIEKGNVYIG